MLLRQLYELAIRYRLPEGEIAKVRSLAANVATRLESVPLDKRDKRRSEIVQNLVKSRLIVGVDPNLAVQDKKLKSPNLRKLGD